MTSRDATNYLPLRETVDHRIRRKSFSDWAHILAFGAIGWPWLLRSLSGGSAERRAAVLERLSLPQDALPNLGSWKADAALLDIIADTVLERRPETVVEFGMGATTLVIARALEMNGGGRLVSFDQHEEYVGSVRDWLSEYELEADLRHAPLIATSKDWPGRWYMHGSLPDRIDLLIIDGPPWAVHPFGRGAADSVFERIPSGGVILMDDGARPGERIIARRWRKRWPDFDFHLDKAGTKGTLIGVRR